MRWCHYGNRLDYEEASPVLAATAPAEDKGKPAPFGFYNFKSIVSSGGSSHSLQGPRKFQTIFGIYDAARLGKNLNRLASLTSSMAWKCQCQKGTLPQRPEAAPSEVRLTEGEGPRLGAGCGGRGELTAPWETSDGSLRAHGGAVAAAALCQGQSSCLGVSDE